MGFKHLKNTDREQTEEEFIDGARGETSTVVKTKIPKKMISIYLSLDTLQALKTYEETEAKRFESRSYIIDEAIKIWLASKGM